VLIVNLTNTLYLRLSIHLLPPYLQGDNFILIATDISDLKKKEFELNEIIASLVNHLKKLRALRIDNICETLDVEGRKNKLEIANNKLNKEILKLESFSRKIKAKAKKGVTIQVLQIKKGAKISPNSLIIWSGWPDSNRRPPAPKAGILPTVLHPDIDVFAEKGGFEPPVRYPVRQFSKLLV
jgi:hypothetical protein